MARHTSDTTQTENVVLNGPIPNSNASLTSPLKLPNGDIENKQTNRISAPQQTETHEATIQVHDPEDFVPENHTPMQSNGHIGMNGNYHRTDEVDFVQTKVLPKAEQPVFEKVLLPEKRRPERQNIPNPRENTSHTEFVTQQTIDPREMYEHRRTAHDQKQTAYDRRHASHEQNDFNHHDQYHNYDTRYQPHQNFGYVRDHMHTPRKSPSNPQQMPYDRYGNKPLMVVRDYSNARANMSYEQRITSANYRRSNSNNFNNSVSSRSRCKSHCSSDDDENVSAIQPGFVATAAKIWDNRAKRDFNTVV